MKQLVERIVLVQCILGIQTRIQARTAAPWQPAASSRAAQKTGHATVAGRRLIHSSPPKGMIYVYDMPPKYTEDILALPAEWHPEQYDYDQVWSPPLLALSVCCFRGWEVAACSTMQAHVPI